MVILGDREGDQLEALNQNVSCIIVGLNMEISERVLALAEEKGVVIISSVLDTFTIARLINQSIPVGFAMTREHLITFSTEDFTDEIQNTMKQSRYHAFPVIDTQGKCLGTISRRNLLNPKKKRIILVDHNEKDQAADNVEKADILEIIDHHKLGSLETMTPITFRNQPLGCTGTIMYQIYGEKNLEIPSDIAGLLCSAIISDTLMFRSPTCTIQDKMAAGALALIAGVEIPQLAKEMFHAGSNLSSKTADQIFHQDYKKFTTDDGLIFGVGQISSMDNEDLNMIREKLVPVLKTESEKQNVPKIYFMLTNILEESTELICYGKESEQLISVAFKTQPQNGSFILSGIVSRKKQLIPAMMKAAQQIRESDFA
jgi:manganese-dependent inorganic pyrophosphatase